MGKGNETKSVILDKAFDMASELGLEGVTIGVLAKAIGMSKSGLFAHFLSKENLQVEILQYAGRVFSENVIVPALRTEPGIPRIRALVRNWIHWTSKLTGGCIFVTASNDFSNRDGEVRTFLLRQQTVWLATLRRIAQSAIKTGDFRQNIDCDQFAFELYSLLLGFNLYHKLLHNEDIKSRQQRALDDLLGKYRQPAP
jgi:AcrR family transcriptional regulator